MQPYPSQYPQAPQPQQPVQPNAAYPPAQPPTAYQPNTAYPQNAAYQPPQPAPYPMSPTAYPQAYYQPPKKVYQPFEKRDNAFLFIFLASVFLLVDFGIFHAFRLGFTLSYIALFAVSTVYLFNRDRRPSLFSLLCGGISVAGSVTFALYSDYFINAIMVLLIAGLFTLYCLGISGSFIRRQANFKLLFDLGFAAVVHPFEHMGAVVGSIKASAGSKKKHLSAFLGVILALPVLIVIVPLLVSSDAAFEGLIASIAENIGIYLAELAVACLLLPYVFSYMFGKKHRLAKTVQPAPTGAAHKLPVAGCVSFLAMITLTYLVYLFSQLAYFFSAFKGFLPADYTGGASQFARRGFYEMFVICGINVVLISLVGAFSKRNEKGKRPLAVKLLSLFISLFSILLLITAMQKMRLNITTYGFTRNRLLISVFMMMMLVVLVFFILHIFAPRLPYMQPIIIICSVIFVALSFADPDTFTFEQNLKAYRQGTVEYLDMYTISLLDPSEGFLTKAASEKNETLAHQAETYLIESMVHHHGDYTFTDSGELVLTTPDFRSYCRAREAAKAKVKQYYDALPKERQQEFILIYKTLDDYGWYDREEDRVYGEYLEDGYLQYNKKTHRYESVSDTYE